MRGDSIFLYLTMYLFPSFGVDDMMTQRAFFGSHIVRIKLLVLGHSIHLIVHVRGDLVLQDTRASSFISPAAEE